MSTSRRRLLKASMGAAPVVLTFISQPVRADFIGGPVTCRAASAFASITANAVTSANTAQQCTGSKPSSWLASNTVSGQWPTGLQTKLFSSAFGAYTITIPAATSGGQPTVNAAPTFLEVLNYSAGAGPADILAKNLVAAFLNHEKGLVPDTVVSKSQLQTMWLTVGVGSGNYPVTGISGGWTIIQVNSFIGQTFS